MALVIDPVHIAINGHPQLRSLTHYLPVEVNAWTMIPRVVTNALEGISYSTLSAPSVARIDITDVPRLIGFEVDGCSDGLVCAGTRDENVGILTAG